MMFKPKSKYFTYILRFWEEFQDEQGMRIWRFALKNPVTGERFGFSTLEELSEFLEKQTENLQS